MCCGEHHTEWLPSLHPIMCMLETRSIHDGSGVFHPLVRRRDSGGTVTQTRSPALSNRTSRANDVILLARAHPAGRVPVLPDWHEARNHEHIVSAITDDLVGDVHTELLAYKTGCGITKIYSATSQIDAYLNELNLIQLEPTRSQRSSSTTRG